MTLGLLWFFFFDSRRQRCQGRSDRRGWRGSRSRTRLDRSQAAERHFVVHLMGHAGLERPTRFHRAGVSSNRSWNASAYKSFFETAGHHRNSRQTGTQSRASAFKGGSSYSQPIVVVIRRGHFRPNRRTSPRNAWSSKLIAASSSTIFIGDRLIQIISPWRMMSSTNGALRFMGLVARPFSTGKSGSKTIKATKGPRFERLRPRR